MKKKRKINIFNTSISNRQNNFYFKINITNPYSTTLKYQAYLMNEKISKNIKFYKKMLMSSRI
jgi:hypothetical protein